MTALAGFRAVGAAAARLIADALDGPERIPDGLPGLCTDLLGGLPDYPETSRAVGMQRAASAGEVSDGPNPPTPPPSPAQPVELHPVELSDSKLLARASAAVFDAATHTPKVLEINALIDLGEALLDRSAQFAAVEDQPFVAVGDLAAHVSASRRRIEDLGFFGVAVDDAIARELDADFYITKK